MANLFPKSFGQSNPQPIDAKKTQFGKSWAFDFEAGEFVLSPTGKVMPVTGAAAWLEWCKKAILTERYQNLVYSRNHGHEFDELIERHLSRAANESEIRRITTETLKVDPRTAAVRNFVFDWQEDRCFFTCEVLSVRGESGTITGSVVSN